MSVIDRPLAGDALLFHLGDEAGAAESPEILARSGRTARTLVKDHSLRVSIHLLAPGGAVAEHHAEGPVTVQILRGSLTFDAAGREIAMTTGDLLALDAGVVHSVASEEGATFLLTVSLHPAAGPSA